MRKSGWTPSIVPNGDDQDVYLVVDDFGRHGRAWREADVDRVKQAGINAADAAKEKVKSP
jgi:hypothetical protein